MIIIFLNESFILERLLFFFLKHLDYLNLNKVECNIFCLPLSQWNQLQDFFLHIFFAFFIKIISLLINCNFSIIYKNYDILIRYKLYFHYMSLFNLKEMLDSISYSNIFKIYFIWRINIEFTFMLYLIHFDTIKASSKWLI